MINEGSTLTTCWIIFLIQHGATTRACNIPLCHFFIQITERSQVKLSLQRWRPYRRISCSIYKIWIIQSCYYTIVYMKYVMGYLLHGWIDFSIRYHYVESSIRRYTRFTLYYMFWEGDRRVWCKIQCFLYISQIELYFISSSTMNSKNTTVKFYSEIVLKTSKIYKYKIRILYYHKLTI